MFYNVKELADKIGCTPREVLDNSADFVDHWCYNELFLSDYYRVREFLDSDQDKHWDDFWLCVRRKTEFETWLQSELTPAPLGWDKVETSVE